MDPLLSGTIHPRIEVLDTELPNAWFRLRLHMRPSGGIQKVLQRKLSTQVRWCYTIEADFSLLDIKPDFQRGHAGRNFDLCSMRLKRLQNSTKIVGVIIRGRQSFPDNNRQACLIQRGTTFGIHQAQNGIMNSGGSDPNLNSYVCWFAFGQFHAFGHEKCAIIANQLKSAL